VRQAVILAGGKAERMRPYTEDRPKAMVEVAGTPIIEHQLRWLAANGVEDVVVSCGYRADVLEPYLNSLRDLDLYLIFAVEEKPLGRGGGLKLGARSLPHPKESWFGLNGDVITDLPLIQFAEHHARLGTKATVALAPYHSSWGVAELEGDLIRGFVQSPRLPYWINAGIYAMQPEIVGMLPEKGDHEDSLFPELAKAGKLGAFRIEGYWRGIDTVKDMNEATLELQGR
jgi:NDP-sugar pyrophosphorylase family protein